MTRPIRTLNLAQADIERIFNWLETRSPKGSAAWFEALISGLNRITQNPDAFPIAFEARRRWGREIRDCLFKTRRGRRYRIVFEVTAELILGLRARGPGQPPLRKRDLPTE
jgi:plasmid stabilization system protein ParE